MLSNEEMWAAGLMTFDEYVEAEGREPPGDAETERVAARLNARALAQAASHVGTERTQRSHVQHEEE